MEEEPSDEVPGEASEMEEDAPRTSSTALEVEEEIIVPTSASIEVEEDSTGPTSTSLDEEKDLKEISLPSSEWEDISESVAPQEQSSSEMSSLLQEESEGLWSSTPCSSPMSPLPWRPHREDLQLLEEEEGREDRRGPAQTKTKKKAVAKKGALNYTVHPIVPAEKAELLSVARAMHRDNFGRNVKELFHLEREAALKTLETERRASVPCTLPECQCQGFTFIPSRPEEVGEFWLQRRTGFDLAAWRAKCRCKHTHEEHVPHGSRACGARGCSCMAFASSFLCAACDRRWEEHETFFESEETRRKGGRPYGEAYLPFAEMPELRNAVLTGRSEDSSTFQALQARGLPAPSGSRALPLPPSGPRRIVEKDDKKA